MFFSVFSTKLSTIKVKENQRFMEFVIKVVKSGVFLLGIYIPVDTCGYYLSLHFVLSCQCAKRILPTQTKYTP